MKQYFKTLSHTAREVAFFAVVGLLLAVAFSFVRPLEYSSTVRLLVLQRNTSTDAYTAIKAIESVTDNLSQVVYTTTFFDRVLQADHGINKDTFSKIESKRRKQWARAVSTQINRGSGFLTITVYNRDKIESTRIVQAIAQVLMISGWEYVDANIQIKMVDTPLESRFPVRPNIPINAFMGLVLGTLIGAGYVFVNEKKEKQ